jgi:hypothetical protein
MLIHFPAVSSIQLSTLPALPSASSGPPGILPASFAALSIQLWIVHFRTIVLSIDRPHSPGFRRSIIKYPAALIFFITQLICQLQAILLPAVQHICIAAKRIFPVRLVLPDFSELRKEWRYWSKQNAVILNEIKVVIIGINVKHSGKKLLPDFRRAAENKKPSPVSERRFL